MRAWMLGGMRVPLLLVVLLLASALAVPAPTSISETGEEGSPNLSSDWRIEVVDDFEDAGRGSSLALDSREYPHIVYYTELDYGFKHANWTGTGWEIETIDCCWHIPWTSSVAIDDSDHPHVSYNSQTIPGRSPDLRYASWNGNAWMNETVESPGDIGRYNALALDGGGHPHIAYNKLGTFPEIQNDLRYARWDGLVWHIETIERVTGWIGEIPIAVDSLGSAHVSYHAKVDDNYTLKYAKWNGSAWNIEVVDILGGQARGTSMVLDSEGHPHIAYHDGTNEDLKYAAWNGSAWRIEIVDSGGDTGLGFYGKDPSLAVDDKDRPQITYWGNGIRHAWWDEPGWQTEYVDSVPPENVQISLALNASGYPHVSYNDWVAGELKFATRTELPPEPSRSLSLDIDPDTLNLKSKGRWITAYLSAENASVHDMDISAILLQDALAPQRWDYQGDVLMLKFDRQEFMDTVQVGESVQVKLTGKWEDGTAFEAYHCIRVIEP